MSKKMYKQFSCNCMMLHEHRTGLSLQLKKMQRGEGGETSSIDEQHLEEFERLVDESMKSGMQVTLSIADKKGAGFRVIKGIVKNKDIRKGEILMITERGVEKTAVRYILKVES